MQHEITEARELLDDQGNLLHRGWARSPLLHYDRSRVRGRLKEWDYYCVLDDQYGLALTVADLGYLGLVSIVWLDLAQGTFHTVDEMRPFTRGRLGLPPSSRRGDVVFEGRKVRLAVRRDDGGRSLEVDVASFQDGQPLRARVRLEQDPDADSLVVATPFPGKPNAFYYNEKINCMPAGGSVQVGETSHTFDPGAAMGVLDWGRGVWTYRNTWYWGSASWRLDGVPLGWNIGYGFGDLSTHTENLVVYGGRGHKLDQVAFHIPASSYLEPWRFSSNDGRFEMDFQPVLDRSAVVNLLVFRSEQHQVFGRFTGKVVLDDGAVLEVEGLPGFAEEVSNRW